MMWSIVNGFTQVYFLGWWEGNIFLFINTHIYIHQGCAFNYVLAGKPTKEGLDANILQKLLKRFVDDCNCVNVKKAGKKLKIITKKYDWKTLMSI